MSANHRGIVVEGLVRDFKGDINAVDGIDLAVAPGEIYGFLGPNGAGKSTTVHDAHHAAAADGRPRDGGRPRRRRRKAPRCAARSAPRCRRRRSTTSSPGGSTSNSRAGSRAEQGAALPQRGAALLERVGLSDAADRKVGGYSGGMKRRLDLALALLHGPCVLFLDEPTTGLDPQSRTALWDEVERLATEDGVTVFLTTQYLEEADVLADRVGIIDHGHIVAEGTPDALKARDRRRHRSRRSRPIRTTRAPAEVLHAFGEPAAQRPKSVAVRLTAGGRGSCADVVRAFDADGHHAVADLQLHTPSLDDVFLEQDRPLARGRRRRGRGERDGAVRSRA